MSEKKPLKVGDIIMYDPLISNRRTFYVVKEVCEYSGLISINSCYQCEERTAALWFVKLEI